MDRQRIDGLLDKRVTITGMNFAVTGTLKEHHKFPEQYRVTIPDASAEFELHCVEAVQSTTPRTFAMTGVVAIVMLKRFVRPGVTEDDDAV